MYDDGVGTDFYTLLLLLFFYFPMLDSVAAFLWLILVLLFSEIELRLW